MKRVKDRVLHLEAEIGNVVHIQEIGGGCIANGVKLKTTRGAFFLKWGGPEVTQTFEAEAAGLRVLREASAKISASLLVPNVVACDGSAEGFLLLEWIEQGRKGSSFWEEFGRALALMHQVEYPAEKGYGFHTNYFIGRTPQINDWIDTWPAFFQGCRLEPQVALARQQGHWQRAWNDDLEYVYHKLPEWLPMQPHSSVLHGDLWSGNFLVTSAGQPALIDPACYIGHNETDLAMTELFGGFDRAFYDAYQEVMPLDPGYSLRREIYNLYHLINHLNLFGMGYAGQVAATLQHLVMI